MEASDVTDEASAIAFVLERTDAANGDDAAVLLTGPAPTCVSVDSTIEGVHVPLGSAPEALGRRAAARALSDLAAMGAAPLALTCAVHVPEGRWVDAARAVQGLVDRASEQGAAVVGGDFSRARARELALVVTVLGRRASGRARFVTRSGARAGDLLVVTGSIGSALTAAEPGTLELPDRLRAGRVLARFARAMTDVSDGLAIDARHLAAASGCAAELELDAIPLAAPHLNPLDAAGVGDDYELLLALSPARLDDARAALAEAIDDLPLTVVGRLADGPAGHLQVTRDGAPVDAPTGFLHR